LDKSFTIDDAQKMNNQLSIVIICKNEKGNIERVLQSVVGVTSDIVIYDSGSTDGTLVLLQSYPVRLHQGEWMGFGKTKQHATSLALHDWVLSIDADEALDEDLQQTLKRLTFDNDNTVYQIRRKNFLGDKHLRWGEWGSDKLARLFNRQKVTWDNAIVHEQLQVPATAKLTLLDGHILHRTMKDTVEYSNKMVSYALLNAEKYYQHGKRATWIKRFVAPSFSFIKHYVFQLGFLDGWEGLLSARMTSFYTSLKYARLHELWRRQP
jgi:glycosyltransferase involved in cell wall biosynthesis